MIRFYLSFWYFFKRPIIIFPIMGIALGLGTLIVVHSVMNGFAHKLVNRIRGISADITIRPVSSDGYIDSKEVMDKLFNLEEIKFASASVEFVAIIQAKVGVSNSFQTFGVRVLAVDLENEMKLTNLANYFFFNGDDDKKDFTEGLVPVLLVGCGIGINPYLSKTASIITMRPDIGISFPLKKDFNVVGLFCSDMYEYDSNYVYIPLLQAQKMLGLSKTKVSKISVKVSENSLLNLAANKIQNLLGEKYQVYTWWDEKYYLLRAVEVEKAITQIIVFLIILVACFSICALLYIIVISKTKEIGILASMGATNIDFFYIFLLIGVYIGIVGVFLGIVIGIGFTNNINEIASYIYKITKIEVFPKSIYLFERIPTKTNLSTVIYFALATFVISILTSLYPAYKATKLPPAQALRYE